MPLQKPKKSYKRTILLTRSTKPDGTPSTNSDNIKILISSVKREIVETIRRVVDMLGKYSSQYLPMDAKQNVRSFILNLPNRLVLYN
jgi:hypothetical protein